MAEKHKRYYELNKDKCRKRSRDWYHNNKDSRLAYARQWRLDNRESIKEYKRAWRKLHKEKYRPKDADREKKRLERLAGRTKPMCCEVCGHGDRIICFDHNHQTGEFRGWICTFCNTALGMAGDSPNVLRLLAEYLEK